MRLADFILENLEPVLSDWEEFARSIPPAREFDAARLRDHAEQMLRTIAEDLRTSQTAAQQFAKSQGRAPREDRDTAAEHHGEGRYAEGFSIQELATEYRALRAAVIRHWTAGTFPAGREAHQDLIRFNEAIDQALAESIERFERDRARDREVQRAAEAAARESENRLALAFRTLPVGLAIVDAAGSTITANEQIHRFLPNGVIPSRDPDRAAHWRAWDDDGQRIPPEDFPGARALRGEDASSGIPMLYCEAAGHEVWTEVRAAALRGEDGAITGALVVVIDVDHMKRTQEALEAADRQKNEFLAMLAHELRNPLAPIRNAGELLKRLFGADPRAQAPLLMLTRQTSQLARLVDDLLDVSRIAQGRIQLAREHVEIAKVIDQAVETVQALARDNHHELRIERPAEVGYVLGDAARLVQVLGNVLTNAVKYTSPGGQIRLDARATDRDVELHVIDNGCGIGPELLPHVFDLFVQSERTLDRSQGGLGVGLSVVKRLVEMHGGSVAVASDGMGRGTTVTIRLPRVPGPGPVPTRHRLPGFVPRRILVADDNRDAADSMAMLLSAEGHQVEAVYSAHAVLDAAKRLQPDFVLLDVGLPHMNGYEVARRLRQAESLQRTRIVAVTGYGQEQDRQRGLAAGFDDYVVKPASLDEVARILAGVGPTTAVPSQ